MSSSLVSKATGAVREFLLGRVIAPVQYWAQEWADEEQLQSVVDFFGALAVYVRAHPQETWSVSAQTKRLGKLPFERKYKFIETYGSEIFTMEGGVQAAAFLCDDSSFTIDQMRRLLTCLVLGVEKRRGNYGTTLRSDFTDANYLNRKEQKLVNAHIVRGFGKKVSDGKRAIEVDLSKPVPPPTQYAAAFHTRTPPQLTRPQRQYTTKAPYALALGYEKPESMCASSFVKYTRSQIAEGVPSQACRFSTTASLGHCIGEKPEVPEHVRELCSTFKKDGTLLERTLREEAERPDSGASSEAPSRLSTNTYVQEKPKYFETLRKQAERKERKAANKEVDVQGGSVACRSYRRADPELVRKIRPKAFKPPANVCPFDTQAVLDQYTTDYKAHFQEENTVKTSLEF